ncbi:MAG: hypothetical protein KDD60_03415 [Bdellovibrionales bacterium]|nr:hypothetical protein [Bdellovibrionales bacterium]
MPCALLATLQNAASAKQIAGTLQDTLIAAETSPVWPSRGVLVAIHPA